MIIFSLSDIHWAVLGSQPEVCILSLQKLQKIWKSFFFSKVYLLFFLKCMEKDQMLLRKIMRISFTREMVLVFYRHCIASHSSTHIWHSIPHAVIHPCWGPSITKSWTAFRLSLSAVCRVSYIIGHDHPSTVSNPMIHIHITTEDRP